MDITNLMANMLATKLCHDITGPISAINQGIELMEDDGMNMRAEAMALIASSAKDAETRLKFYRLAYGHVAAGGERSLYAKRELLDAFFAGLKITIDWSDAQTAKYTDAELRLVLNLMLIASGTMLRNGTMTLIDRSAPGCVDVRLELSAALMKREERLFDILNGEVKISPEDPKIVQYYLTLELLKLLGGTLKADAQNENAWSLHFKTGE